MGPITPHPTSKTFDSAPIQPAAPLVFSARLIDSIKRVSSFNPSEAQIETTASKINLAQIVTEFEPKEQRDVLKENACMQQPEPLAASTVHGICNRKPDGNESHRC
jgi:hypothetical protein